MSDHLVDGLVLAFDGVLLRHAVLAFVERLFGEASAKRVGHSHDVLCGGPAVAAEPALQDFEQFEAVDARVGVARGKKERLLGSVVHVGRGEA